MGKKKKLLKRLRDRVYNRRANSALEYGNDELYNEYIEAQMYVERAEEKYEEIISSYESDAKRKERLLKKIDDLEAKREEKLGGIKILGLRFPLLLSYIHTKWLESGITKEGREFREIEGDINLNERVLSRIYEQRNKKWQKMLEAEQEIEEAETYLGEVETKIKAFNRTQRNIGQIEATIEQQMPESQAAEAEQEQTQRAEMQNEQLETQENQTATAEPVQSQEQESQTTANTEQKTELEVRYENTLHTLDDLNKEIAKVEGIAKYNKSEQKRLNELLFERDVKQGEINKILQQIKAKKTEGQQTENTASKQTKSQQKEEGNAKTSGAKKATKQKGKNRNSAWKSTINEPYAILYQKHNINRDRLKKALGKKYEPEEFAYTLGLKYIAINNSDKGLKKEIYIEKGLSILDKLGKGENVPRLSDIMERLDNGETIDTIPGFLPDKRMCEAIRYVLNKYMTSLEQEQADNQEQAHRGAEQEVS